MNKKTFLNALKRIAKKKKKYQYYIVFNTEVAMVEIVFCIIQFE